MSCPACKQHMRYSPGVEASYVSRHTAFAACCGRICVRVNTHRGLVCIVLAEHLAAAHLHASGHTFEPCCLTHTHSYGSSRVFTCCDQGAVSSTTGEVSFFLFCALCRSCCGVAGAADGDTCACHTGGGVCVYSGVVVGMGGTKGVGAGREGR